MSFLVPPTRCHYCNGKVALVQKSALFLMDPEPSGQVYQCQWCQARIGCHKGKKWPLGMLADLETREARRRAHRAFDGLWLAGHVGRFKGYAWLARKLGLDHAVCHIGWMDAEVCERVVEICQVPPTSEELEGLSSRRPWIQGHRLKKPFGLADLHVSCGHARQEGIAKQILEQSHDA